MDLNQPLALNTTSKQRYQIHTCLAQRQHSSVYIARQEALGRDVVLKFISDIEPHVVHRFKREVLALARLKHPNNVRILDFGVGVIDNIRGPFLVMDHVDGVTLRERLSHRGRLTPREAVDIGCQLLRGLTEAHRNGIIHRDIKPENLMLTEHRDLGTHVTLIDYGIARLDSHTPTLTHERITVGTPAYMAPELAKGDPPSGLTDIYSVGILLYECLAGRAPFRGSDPLSVLYQHSNTEPAPLLDLAPSASRELCAVIHKAIHKDPMQRYPSTVRFLRALEKLVSRGTVDVREHKTLGTGDFSRETLIDDLPHATRTMAPTAKQRPAIWVLDQDPGVTDDLIALVERTWTRGDVVRLAPEERELMSQSLRDGDIPPPWIVIFGDLHVILRDPLLEQIEGRGETSRLLVSTHLNEQMMQMAINFCGVDHQLINPISEADLHEGLERVYRRTSQLRSSFANLQSRLHNAQEHISEQLALSRVHRTM